MTHSELHKILRDAVDAAVTRCLEHESGEGDPAEIREILEEIAQEVCGD